MKCREDSTPRQTQNPWITFFLEQTKCEIHSLKWFNNFSVVMTKK